MAKVSIKTYEYLVNNDRLSFEKGIKCPSRGIACGIGRGSNEEYVGDVYHAVNEKKASMPPQIAVQSPIIVISR